MEVLKAHDLNRMARYALTEEIDWFRQLKDKGIQESVMIGAGPGVLGAALLEVTGTMLAVIDIVTTIYCQKHYEQMGLDYGVRYIIDDSVNVAKSWERKLDFLIVDGDHSYNGVMRDIEAWLPHVKSGGTIFFHDYLESVDGPVRIVEPRYAVYGGVAKAIEDSGLEVANVVGLSAIVRKV